MTLAIQIILGFLPGLIWLLFYMQEDPKPEPKSLIFATFLAGAVSAIAALFLEAGAAKLFELLKIRELSAGPIVFLAFIEELMKFAAAFIVIHKSRAFDEPVDAMIYALIAALGFATVENLGAVLTGFKAGAPILAVAIKTTAFRFVGATLLHSLTSSLVGYYWALDIRNFGTVRFRVKGLLLATILHAIFNYIILWYGSLTYTIIFVVIVGFFALNDFERLKAEKI